jgi:hypothetical protein
MIENSPAIYCRAECSVFGTVQYSPKGMGHTAEGHQPIEQDGVMMTGENNVINLSLRWSCQRDRALGLLICRAYRRYQPHRGVMSIAKIKKQNQLQRSAMPIV